MIETVVSANMLIGEVMRVKKNWLRISQLEMKRGCVLCPVYMGMRLPDSTYVMN